MNEIFKVLSIRGSFPKTSAVFAKKLDETIIPVTPGIILSAGDSVTTPDGVELVINLDSGKTLTIESDQVVSLSDDMLLEGGVCDPSSAAISIKTPSIVQQAMLSVDVVEDLIAGSKSLVTDVENGLPSLLKDLNISKNTNDMKKTISQ